MRKRFLSILCVLALCLGLLPVTALAREGGTYTVHFAAGVEGVEGSMEDVTAVIGERWDLPACTFTRTGYSFDGWTTDPDGSGKVYADEDTVQDLAGADETVTLYVRWHIHEYYIWYDRNVPPSNTTAPEDSWGRTDPQYDLQYNQLFNLRKNGYRLPGYRSTGWNTQPDGSGTAYSEEAEVINLTAEDNALVVLYAQWEPLPYTVSFQSGGGSGEMDEQTLWFDRTDTLHPNQFSCGGHIFLGWLSESDSTQYLYGDENAVANLCTLVTDDKPKGYTLTALWGEEKPGVYVTITDDNKPVDLVNPGTEIQLVSAEGSTIQGFTAAAGLPGTYFLAGVPQGEYKIEIEGYPSGGQVTVDSETTSVLLGFSTMEFQKEREEIANIDEVFLNDQEVIFTPGTNTTEFKFLNGTQVSIFATPKPGFSFDYYNMYGVAPAGVDIYKAEQTVKVQGPVCIYPWMRGNRYRIVFDANVPAGASTAFTGKMNDQELVYNDATNLHEFRYQLPGYICANWNTDPGGSGTQVNKGATISTQFPVEDNGTVTLYAQWTPREYLLTFDPGTGMGTEWNEVFSFDEETLLPAVAALQFSGPNGLPFIGWLAKKTDRFYADQEMVTNVCTLNSDGGPEGLTLTALWGYKVTLHPNGGEVADCTVDKDGNYVISYTQDSGTLLPTGATRTGYQFEGWYDGGNRVTSVSAANSGKTYDARWTANTYTVTFDANGSSGSTASQPFTYDQEQPLTANAFTRTGYTFIGWNTKADGTGTSYSDGAAVSNLTAVDGGTVTLYAQWAATYAVTLNPNGGTIADGKNVTSYTYGVGADLPTAADITRSGYIFQGWYEAPDFSGEPVTEITAADFGKKVFYAKWQDISSSDPTYSVTLPGSVEGGTVTAYKRYAEAGETFYFTVTSNDGWVLDTLTVTDRNGKKLEVTDKGDGVYSFQMPAGRVEIQVSFREIAVELPFTDVPEDAWYADAVRYVYKHDLMAGTSATAFSPDATTSRSMIATILWRMAGSPVVNYAMDYTDVAQGQWYSEAIRWAASEGIVGGYGNGLFGTNDPITREQFAAMLYRFAQEQGYDVSIGENTNILSYTDVADLSEYAISAMQWAVGAGIINGTGDGSTLSPQGQATRAQVAVILTRYCENVAKQ